MHYHTESDEDVYDPSIFGKMDNDEEDHSSLTSQTLNADGTPKRPMNAFMIFARRRRPQVSAEHQSLRTGDISKILSQEWKAMLPADKQFYLTQAKQLKESFNKKYPEYVYRRRPNNSRKRRKPDAAGAGAPSPATDEAESSPDGEEPPPLPDAHRYPASPYDRYVSSGSPYAASSSASYGSSAYSYSGGAHGHVRTQSYPYPPTNAGEYRYDARNGGGSGGGLPGTAYYPPYDANHPLPSSSSSHSVNGAGLRKAHSIPSMPTTSAPQSWAPSSTPTSHSHSHSHSSASSSASHPSSTSTHSNGTPTASSAAYYTHHSHPAASYSPPLPTRYSPYSASSASPASNSYSGSPAPVYSSPYTAATASPPSTHANSSYTAGQSGTGGGGGGGGGGGYSNDSPRALAAHLGGLSAASNVGVGGGGSALGLSGHGLGLSNGLGIAGQGGAGLGVGGEYYWRADKLL
ncbi:hypothetical protein DFH06DRAFT_754002 [Mycena polygramma]|nr:hypothetical protein DFH06DRAFT_754002 [Mycena polygramma]